MTSLESQFQPALLKFIGKTVDSIRPRAQNRTVTSWETVVTLNADDSVEKCQTILSENNILGAPVIDADKKFMGFVDQMDIVKMTLDHVGTDVDEKKQKVLEEDLKLAFQKQKVRDIIRKETATHFIWSGYSMFSALEHLAKGHNIYRIAIVDTDMKVLNVLMPSMLIGQIYNMTKDGTIPMSALAKPMLDMKGNMQVATILETDSALKAFKKMLTNDVGGLAVIDKDGNITNSISIRDLRGIGKELLFSRLLKPVVEFKARELETSQPAVGKKLNDKIFLTDSQASFATIVSLLDQNHIHRVFITSAGSRKPFGVVSQRDVLNAILPLAPIYGGSAA